jgi:uncharacterized protein (TIGR02300 family)
MIGNASRSQQLGEKRSCLECGTKFYDLGHNPVICPKCKTQFISPILPESVVQTQEDRAIPREIEEISLNAIVEEDLVADDETLVDEDAEEDAFEEEEEEELSDFIRGDINEDDET